DAELGKGSVFTFTLPYSPADAADQKRVADDFSTAHEKAVESTKPHSLAGKKALVVEDNDVNTMLLTLLLKKFDMSFVVAKDGAEGLSAYASQPFDIVLTDINVPKLTGDQLAQEIRKGHGFVDKKIPIIALTASIVQDDLDAYMKAGINDVLVKPFSQEGLRTMLQKYLG
ncbi:MAG: response regulator, partial [Sphingobacteriia bacterium]